VCIAYKIFANTSSVLIDTDVAMRNSKARTRTTEAWLDTVNNDKIPAASIYRNNRSPPIVVGHVGSGVGNLYSDPLEPMSGFPEDNVPSDIHRPAILKPFQKRRPSRGICCGIILTFDCFQLKHFCGLFDRC